MLALHLELELVVAGGFRRVFGPLGRGGEGGAADAPKPGPAAAVEADESQETMLTVDGWLASIKL
eukprot:COSAG06_NODE_540_length_14473_cov_34.614164_3_plen_65_part_00